MDKTVIDHYTAIMIRLLILMLSNLFFVCARGSATPRNLLSGTKGSEDHVAYRDKFLSTVNLAQESGGFDIRGSERKL
jgi:hypothetical protein